MTEWFLWLGDAITPLLKKSRLTEVEKMLWPNKDIVTVSVCLFKIYSKLVGHRCMFYYTILSFLVFSGSRPHIPSSYSRPLSVWKFFAKCGLPYWISLTVLILVNLSASWEILFSVQYPEPHRSWFSCTKQSLHKASHSRTHKALQRQSCCGPCRGSQRDVVFLGRPIETSYMSDILERKRQNAGVAGSHWLCTAVRMEPH